MKVKNREEVRAGILSLLVETLAGAGKDVGQMAGNTLVFPVVAVDGEEGFATVTVTIPQGSKDGTPFDGYAEIKAYADHLTEKAEKAEKAKAEKEAKLAKKAADKAAKEATA